ncbi:hypothetical protein B5F44_09690 [Gordonibacter urolithinfaciens]|uniref:ASCH domain-containing protein n=1 Tax=Gordonibacter urolithinfaciens TaxID=1335613 RepID=UPI000B37363A|nr:ASCH domain-containing protein [Gordonibacter urolithinfaciens]OUO86568.1 hypothetical protein B5F44_09690 [Gordonibacter urolithinfaciens]
MSSILISIKPEFAEKIFNGTKKYEFRKRGCRRPIQKLIIYATFPVMKIVGEAKVKGVIDDSPEEVWGITKSHAGISADYYYSYFDGKDKAVAYCLEGACLYDKPKELSVFGVSHAPQSFIYID